MLGLVLTQPFAALQAPTIGRRAMIGRAASACAASAGASAASAFDASKDDMVASQAKAALVPSSAALDDLPRGARTVFMREWPALQLGTDSYVFEVRDRVGDPTRWDLVGSFLGRGGDSSSSRVERELLAPMTVLSLAFPPDAGGEDMQAALGRFRAAMGRLGRVAIQGPYGASKQELATALREWEAGRDALNAFSDALNAATGTTRLQTIPADYLTYPRSKARYTQLIKDTALCRNRGGEQLAGLWGNLMVYGTVPGVNPCGDINLANYFT
tara:strand:+ start:202 stop:1017 length:816 start_codon:yes stop_codon:yes gene_type:complete